MQFNKTCRHSTPCFPLTVVSVLIAIVIATGCAQLPNTVGEIVSDDDPTMTKEALDTHFGVIRIVERNGKLEDAQKAYLEMIDRYPDYTPALHRLGVIAVRQENLDLAIEYLELASEHEPDSAEILGDLGYAYLVRCELEKATDILRKGFRIAPDDERVSNNLGLALGYQGLIQESLTMFRRTNPESQALTNVGYILSQRGDLQNAASYFHRALDLDPTIEQAAIGLIELNRLSNPPAPQTPETVPQNPSTQPQRQLISTISER